MNATVLIVLVLSVLAAGAVLLLVVRWRPERVALVLAAVVVVLGLGATAVGVVDAVGDDRVEFAGTLDAEEILDTYSPPEERVPQPGSGYLTSARGVVTKPQAGTRSLAAWSIGELAPWLLAAIVLGLVWPILRAADRGDPFRDGCARRLRAVGVLLLLGIPAVAIVQFIAAHLASAGNFLSPGVEPALTISLAQLLPGVLVLVLAGVFRRGGELRDLERHTI